MQRPPIHHDPPPPFSPEHFATNLVPSVPIDLGRVHHSGALSFGKTLDNQNTSSFGKGAGPVRASLSGPRLIGRSNTRTNIAMSPLDIWTSPSGLISTTTLSVRRLLDRPLAYVGSHLEKQVAKQNFPRCLVQIDRLLIYFTPEVLDRF